MDSHKLADTADIVRIGCQEFVTAVDALGATSPNAQTARVSIALEEKHSTASLVSCSLAAVVRESPEEINVSVLVKEDDSNAALNEVTAERERLCWWPLGMESIFECHETDY